MRMKILLPATFLLFSFSQLDAAPVGVIIEGDFDTDPFGVAAQLLVAFVMRPSDSQEDTTPSSQRALASQLTGADEFLFQSSNPDAGNFFEISELSVDGVSLLQSSAAAFQTLQVDLLNDTTLPDGTVTGDTVAFSFSGGSVLLDGEVVQQLDFKFQDSSATIIDGTDFEQIIGLDLAETTSATFLALTNTSIKTGLLTSVSSAVVPIPASLPLLGAALAGLSLAGWRRKIVKS